MAGKSVEELASKALGTTRFTNKETFIGRDQEKIIKTNGKMVPFLTKEFTWPRREESGEIYDEDGELSLKMLDGKPAKSYDQVFSAMDGGPVSAEALGESILSGSIGEDDADLSDVETHAGLLHSYRVVMEEYTGGTSSGAPAILVGVEPMGDAVDESTEDPQAQKRMVASVAHEAHVTHVKSMVRPQRRNGRPRGRHVLS